MTNTNTRPEPLYDVDGNCIDIEPAGPTIGLSGWHLVEDSQGKPYQRYADKLYLTRRQAIELARRLLIAATE